MLQRTIFILSVLLFFACKPQYPGEQRKINLAAIYNPMATQLHPVYKAYNNTDNSTLIYVKLFTSELLFIPSETGQIAKVDITLELQEVENNEYVSLDSNTYQLSIKKKEKETRYFTQLAVKTEIGKRYQLKIFAKDLYRKSINIKYLEIDRTEEISSNDFLLLGLDNKPIFSSHIRTGAGFKLQHRFSDYKGLHVGFDNEDLSIPKETFPSPAPSFNSEIRDSSWYFPNITTMRFELPYRGQYYLKIDSAHENGLVLNCLWNDFPKISEAEDMLKPVGYLITDIEHKKLLQEKNTKLGLDRFWLELGDSPGKSREMIRIFYNRVYFSNYYFTGHVPGWSSDMGMVYVVYGPPHSLKKYPNSEEWLYYDEKYEDPMRFRFYFDPVPGNAANYSLSRAENGSWRWTETIYKWRSGEIFSYN